jgi:hypothetical protein
MPADGQAFGDHNATARTSLAGVSRRHGDCPLPGACCLESEDAQERRPAGIGDALGEMMVPDHVGRLQVFMVDHVVLLNEGQRRLMVEIRSLTAHFLMRLGKQRYRFPTAVAPLLAATHPPLCGFERTLGLAIAPGREDARTIGERGECL